MTITTELAQRMREAAENNFAPLLSIPNKDVLALLDALEAKSAEAALRGQEAQTLSDALKISRQRIAELESQRQMAFMACNRWADKFREAESKLEARAEQQPVALPVQHWEELCRQNPDMSIGDAIIRAAWWNHCAASLQANPPAPAPVTVMQNAMRSFITDDDIAALNRFADCIDDPDSGGHDLEKEQVARLEKIGALQRSGRISYITDFGDLVISVYAGIKIAEGE